MNIIDNKFFMLLQSIFSNLEFGIIILSKQNIIEMINPAAEKLLDIEKNEAVGKKLEIICPELFFKDKILNGNTTLINGKNIKIDIENKSNNTVLYLKQRSQQEIFLKTILNSLEEAIMVCDKNGKLLIYNNANEKLDELSKYQVIGNKITSIYRLTKETSLMHQVMKKRKPILNRPQNYTTHKGKNINIMCNTYPLIQDGEVIGAVSVQKDYSQVKELSDKIIELQDQLFDKNDIISSKYNKNSKSVRYNFEDIKTANTLMQQTIDWAKRAAKTDSPVLIYGETGTGKELFAQSIHNCSKRANKPFLAVNCAAIPANLLEGILFGTVKGAYTGAVDRPGFFEQANEGTILLDEINSMSIELQAKLLRVLQEGTLRRVGDIQETPVDVRIITNINTKPLEAIENKQLREDLFYRLSVVYFEIPPLSNRKEDITILCSHFIKKYNLQLKKSVQNLDSEVMDIFMNHSWPGNIRELQHTIESGMNIMYEDEIIMQVKHLPAHLKNKFKKINHKKDSLHLQLKEEKLNETLTKVEKYIICLNLHKNNWNISETAKSLGVKRQSLQYRIKKHSIEKRS
jgi:arginine utilization regulatory protein